LTARVGAWLRERENDCFVAAHGGVARARMVLLAGVAGDVADGAEIPQGRAMIFEDGAFAAVG
jgi:bisphosphoglycerate-dependent phosphoglycerate mutase